MRIQFIAQHKELTGNGMSGAFTKRHYTYNDQEKKEITLTITKFSMAGRSTLNANFGVAQKLG
jgi:hypothetical protein